MAATTVVIGVDGPKKELFENNEKRPTAGKWHVQGTPFAEFRFLSRFYQSELTPEELLVVSVLSDFSVFLWLPFLIKKKETQ
jgi:hypothetical protein